MTISAIQPTRPTNQWAALALIVVAQFMVILDVAIVNVALPSASGSLVAFRGIQGLGGALLAPAGLSLLMTTFAEGRDRNLALGIWGAASGSGAAIGVLLGGVLTSYLSWSWVFFINVPVGLAAIALAPVLLSESRADVAYRHFDVPGAVSITAG